MRSAALALALSISAIIHYTRHVIGSIEIGATLHLNRLNQLTQKVIRNEIWREAEGLMERLKLEGGFV